MANTRPQVCAVTCGITLNAGVSAMAKKVSKKAKKNTSRTPVEAARKTAASAARRNRAAAKPKLLSGGNPQIAKADGDAPVRAYISAMPGWKRDVGRRLDAIIVRTVPGVRKAVRWNSPFYGVPGPASVGGGGGGRELGWFLSMHCLTNYVKVCFVQGASLRPAPPVASKMRDVRYLHIHEGDRLDETLLASWIRQASELPGTNCF